MTEPKKVIVKVKPKDAKAEREALPPDAPVPPVVLREPSRTIHYTRDAAHALCDDSRLLREDDFSSEVEDEVTCARCREKMTQATAAPTEPLSKPVKLPKIGDEVTVVKLTNLYDKYAPDVLRGLLESAPKKRGAPRRWTVRGDLPQPAQYRGMKQTQYTRTVESLIDDAFSDLESVAEEVRSWYDALPEGLQQADRGSRLDEAANTLEGLQRPDVPEAISGVTVVYYPGLKVESRADRVSEAVSMLQTARDAIDTDGDEARVDCEDCEGKGKKDCDHCGTTDAVDCDECGGSGKVEVEGLDDFVSELESAIGDAEGVEIPGMYG